MMKFSEKNARIVAWIVFGLACLLVLVFVGWMLKDGTGVAVQRCENFADTVKLFATGGWNFIADALTDAIDASLGGFTGTNYKAMNIGHWVLTGLIGLAIVAGIFVLLFFRN